MKEIIGANPLGKGMIRRSSIFTMFFIGIFLVILMTFDVKAAAMSYDSAKNAINMTYDGANRILSQRSGSEWVNYTYDAEVKGTVTNITSSNGVSVRYVYDNRTRQVREIKIIDGYAFERNLTYDSKDRATSIGGSSAVVSIGYGSNALMNALIGIVNLAYNERNQPANKSFNNALTSIFSYNQNSARLTEIQTDNKQDLIYSYDNYGNIIGINDTVNSRNISLQYDGLHRLVFANISAQQNHFFTYVYNSLGNLLIINSTNGTSFYTYTSLAHAPTSINSGANTPPTTPTTLLCAGTACYTNGTFSNTLDINCSGSTDSEGDSIAYSIEGYTLGAGAGWWNASWGRRKMITVSEVSSETVVNYSMRLNVSYVSSMQSDFDDLRFVTPTGSELNYWIEEKGIGSYALVWIKVPSITGSTNPPFYMYYNNSNVGTTSNENTTFILYDSFSGSTLNTSLWHNISNGTVNISFGGGNITLESQLGGNNNRLYIYSNASTPNGVMVWRRNYTSAGEQYREGFDEFFYPGPLEGRQNAAYWGHNLGGNLFGGFSSCNATSCVNNESDDAYYQGTHTLAITTYRNATFARNTLSLDGVLKNTTSQDINSVGLNAHYGGNNFIKEVIDWVYVRNYVEPEPTLSIGSEETPGGYSWSVLGDHSASNILTWDIHDIINETNISLRCRAIDVSGSNNFSSYYSPAMNITIANVTPLISFVSPTPANGSLEYASSIYVNISSSDDERQHYTFVDFDKSLVFWLRMDDVNNSGDPFDLSTYSRNASKGGNAVQSIAGKFGRAFTFDGNGDYLQTSTPVTSQTDNIALSLWIKWAGSTGNDQIMVYNGNTSSTGFGLRLDNAEGNQYEVMVGGVGYVETSDTLPVNQWTHLAAVRSKGNWTIYKNGNVVTIDSGGTSAPNTPTLQTLVGINNALGASFNGSIDEVMMFNRSLSQQEIRSLYNATAYQYSNNFLSLSYGDHVFRGHDVDLGGRRNRTEWRTVNLQPEINFGGGGDDS